MTNRPTYSELESRVAALTRIMHEQKAEINHLNTPTRRFRIKNSVATTSLTRFRRVISKPMRAGISFSAIRLCAVFWVIPGTN